MQILRTSSEHRHLRKNAYHYLRQDVSYFEKLAEFCKRRVCLNRALIFCSRLIAIRSKQNYQSSFYHLLQQHGPTFDALDIVQSVVNTFPAFRDEAIHPKVGKVHLWKRPQILVAELWAAISSCPDRYPQITNISALTMFADYRVPQILHDLGLITYSPYLQGVLARKEYLESGSELEINIRAASIVAVDQLVKVVQSYLIQQGRKREASRINAVLLDFWLWNKAKEMEKEGKTKVECHRTRSIWY